MSDPIEVEVLEIDGAAPHFREAGPSPAANQPWQAMRGRIRQLDSRWWPLWVVLGIIALALVLTLGVVVAAAVVLGKIVTSVIRALSRMLLGVPQSTSLR